MNTSDQVLKFLYTGLVPRLTKMGLAKSPIDAEGFWLSLLKLLRSDEYLLNVEKGPITFVVNPNSTSGNGDIFQKGFLKSYFDNGTSTIQNVFYVNYSGQIIDDTYKNVKFLNRGEVSDDSENKGSSFFHVFVKGNELDVVCNRLHLHSIADITTMNRFSNIRGTLPIENYRTMIQRHYEKEIVGQSGLIYWDNKTKWELVAKPEQHFRKRLLNFITDYISNGHVEEESYTAGDRTDIKVIERHSGDIYYIEIKWVGKSKGVNYDGKTAHDKANEGINQLHTYVKSENKCVKGILVVYDARKKKLDIKWLPPAKDWNKRLDADPFLLDLDPTSASSKAKAAVKKNPKRK
jgi:hypothetical protein